MHQAMASTLDRAMAQIKQIQNDARINRYTTRPRWPMIILKSPKDWTGPRTVNARVILLRHIIGILTLAKLIDSIKVGVIAVGYHRVAVAVIDSDLVVLTVQCDGTFQESRCHIYRQITLH